MSKLCVVYVANGKCTNKLLHWLNTMTIQLNEVMKDKGEEDNVGEEVA